MIRTDARVSISTTAPGHTAGAALLRPTAWCSRTSPVLSGSKPAGSRPVAGVSRRWQFGVTLVNQRQRHDAIHGDMNLKRTFAVLTLGISQLWLSSCTRVERAPSADIK